MENTAASANPLGIDPVVLKLAAALYAPTMEVEDLGDEAAQFLGQLVLTRCGPLNEHALTRVAYHVAESGVPDDMLIDWAETNGVEAQVRAGMDKAHVDARKHAAAILTPLSSVASAEQRALQAFDRIAHEAYGNERRKKGTLYYDHAKRAGAMALHGLVTARGADSPADKALITAAVAAALLHDAGEKAKHTPKAYDPAHPEAKYTALSVRYILEQTGNPHGIAVANALRLMTHYPKNELWTPSYRTYITRGTLEPLFRLAKFGDIHDNLVIEPKPVTKGDRKAARERAKKQREYRTGKQQIRHPVPQRGIVPTTEPWYQVYFDTIDGLTAADIPQLMRALEAYMGDIGS